MQRIFTLVAMFVLSPFAGADQFTVVNKCGCEFTVTNKLHLQDPIPRASFYEYRRPVGHTHTCTSCGNTWDHKTNPTHTCSECGGHPPIARGGGYLADPAPRMVRVRSLMPPTEKMVEVTEKFKVVNRVPLPSQVQSVAISSILFPGASAGNCANGNCSTIQQPTKFRLFR